MARGLGCWGMAPSRSAQVYADFLLPHLATETHLVDLGCGSGELSLDLAGEVGHLTGIDGDPAEIGLARSSAEASSTMNAAFAVGDVYALPLAEGGADAVFAHSVLEALDRPDEALAEMSRVLKKNGVVAAACVDVRRAHPRRPARAPGPPVADALAAKITTLPAALTRTLTWDQGHEMAQHVRFTEATGVEVIFCDPQSPWQRGSNENTNGLLRQYLPRTLDFRTLNQADFDAIADELNRRPRQTLGFKTPSQALAEVLR